MKTFILLILALLLGTGSVEAQTHPCDVTTTQPQTVQGGAGNGVGFCHDQKDLEGNSTFITGHRVVVDNVVVFTGQLTQLGGLSATGQAYYETPKTMTFARGNHTVVVYSSNADGESAASAAFTFTIKGPAPEAPVVKQLIK